MIKSHGAEVSKCYQQKCKIFISPDKDGQRCVFFFVNTKDEPIKQFVEKNCSKERLVIVAIQHSIVRGPNNSRNSKKRNVDTNSKKKESHFNI